MKLKIAKRITSAVINIAMFSALIVLVFIVISTKASSGDPEIFGYQLKTVLSGSMEPEFKTGSIIAVKPDGDMTRFQEGDIITFMEREDMLITHRVIDVVQSGEHVLYETKGDNNNAPDSSLVLSENVVAEYSGFTIPYVGYVASFAQSKEGGALLLILPGLMLLLYAGFTIWQGITHFDQEKKSQTSLNESVGSDDVEGSLKT